MSITHDQRADLGVRYLAAIHARERIRVAAKAAADAALKLAEAASASALKAAVTKWLKAHKFKQPFTHVELGDAYRSGPNLPTVSIVTETGDYKPARTEFPCIAKSEGAIAQANKLKGELCREIEHLHSLSESGAVAAFQVYASRLWAPQSKAIPIGEGELKKLVEDFIQSRRPVVCTL